MRRQRVFIALVGLIGLAVAVAARADFDLSWNTVDGGGAMGSTGGVYALSGTTGQPDATTTVMAGGTFTLTGGFWPATQGPGICRGDTNCDGVISYADINPLVQVLGSLSAWQAQYPGCPWQNCDINSDSVISYADINPFVALLAHPGPCP
jgi:hypothetical protein